MNREVTLKKEQKIWRRLFSVTIDSDQIAAWEKDLDRVIALFNVCLCNSISNLMLRCVSSLK
jgi:hypothetical protein